MQKKTQNKKQKFSLHDLFELLFLKKIGKLKNGRERHSFATVRVGTKRWKRNDGYNGRKTISCLQATDFFTLSLEFSS